MYSSDPLDKQSKEDGAYSGRHFWGRESHSSSSVSGHGLCSKSSQKAPLLHVKNWTFFHIFSHFPSQCLYILCRGTFQSNAQEAKGGEELSRNFQSTKPENEELVEPCSVFEFPRIPWKCMRSSRVTSHNAWTTWSKRLDQFNWMQDNSSLNH